MICAFTSGPPDHDAPNTTLKLRGCQWQLTRAEFRNLAEQLPPFDDCRCDEVERAFANFRCGRE